MVVYLYMKWKIKHLCNYTNYTVQKFGVSKIFIVIEKNIDTFIQQGCTKLIKSYNKDIYNATNLILNKYCSFELSTH